MLLYLNFTHLKLENYDSEKTLQLVMIINLILGFIYLRNKLSLNNLFVYVSVDS